MTRQTLPQPHLIHDSAWIAPGAVVIGDVTIAEDVTVWYYAVIRGDTTAIHIGARTNVQDGCILHADPGFPCTLGDDVTLGHGAIVHGATVGDRCVIGMRSVVMNGAAIGEDSIVGVGAVVTAGTQIPPGSLVLGVPAKVQRPLTEDEIVRNKVTADHYVQAGREYKANAADAASTS